MTNTEHLTFDEAEAAGLDGTGRNLDPMFPHRSDSVLTVQAARMIAHQTNCILQVSDADENTDRELVLINTNGDRLHVVDLEAGQTQFAASLLRSALNDDAH